MQVNNMEYAISFDKAFFDVKRYETEHIFFKSIFILYNLRNILIIIFLKILHTFLKFYVVFIQYFFFNLLGSCGTIKTTNLIKCI